MQSLSLESNQNNNQPNCNYQCEFNYSGCKITVSSEEELKQHYKDALNKHLFLLQDKLKHIDSQNYDIKKDYYKLFKIINNIQQFKKFPDICPKPKEKEDKESELNKNKSKKKDKDKEKDKIGTNQNLQSLILNQILKKQKPEDMIGNKRKRSEEFHNNCKIKFDVQKVENLEKNEEITLSSIEDDNNDNDFLNSEKKHKIILNKSEDNDNEDEDEDENNVETRKIVKDKDIKNGYYISHKVDDLKNPININSKENENNNNNYINNENNGNNDINNDFNNEEMNDEQIFIGFFKSSTL